jgi:hypothetical protein
MTRKRGLQRRDATGHLDPKYAADLRVRSLESANGDQGTAFLARSKSSDALASALGEEFVEAATGGEDARLDDFDERTPEDDGGPFIVTSARDEFGHGRDPSNPKGATREPFPKAVAEPGDEQEPSDEQDEDNG